MYSISYNQLSPKVKLLHVIKILFRSTCLLLETDVKNAFLHEKLLEPVYMEQPPGFQDPHRQNFVCRVKRDLYGLRQAPRALFDRFSHFLFSMGFFCSKVTLLYFLFPLSHKRWFFAQLERNTSKFSSFYVEK